MKRIITIASALLLFIGSAFAQQIPALPLDPGTKVGKLDNGMTYYIRHNALPEKRAEFYLATNVGALQETPDQDGLAHFLEHMCFNGTKNFPGKDLLNWLQSIGASFGGNINAATGLEQTQYMLNNIPLVRPSVIDSCLLVMHDYSHFVTLDPKEIDAERGVILEEKRTRNVAGWRNFIAEKKYLYKGSPMADVSLIGSEENLKTFQPVSLENFYHTWYRPDMQALIVVGDFDVNDMEARIKRIFADIPAAENPKAKEPLVVPSNVDPIIGIITDKENTNTAIELYWKSDRMPREYRGTAIGFSSDIMEDIVSNVMNERLNAIAAKPDAPFLNAGLYVSNICTSLDAVIAEAGCKDGEALTALEAIYTEVEKMKRFGFADDEIQRAKDEIISRYESAAAKAETRKNAEFIRPIMNNFFDGKYLLDPAMSLQLVQAIMPQLKADVINKTLSQIISGENLVAVVVAPDKEGLVNPTEAQVLEIIKKVQAADIQPNKVEDVPTSFLNPAKLKGSAIKSTTQGLYGSTVLQLKNGIKVILKPTDKEKDRINFTLFKKGGRSLIADADLYNIEDNIWKLYTSNTGVASFSATTVNKMLSGKQLSVNPFIEGYTNGVSGHSTPKDMETALQLLYLYCASPRFDADEYNQGVNQIKAVLPNLVNQPNYKLQQQLYSTFYNSPRRFFISEDVLAKASLKGLEKVYRQIFSNFDGATFVVVGDFKPEEMIPMVQKYVGSIKKGKATDWKYCGDGFVDDSKVNEFRAVMEQPKVTVLQGYKMNKPYSVQTAVDFEAISYILDMVYTDTMREEEGGTYGASAMDLVGHEPNPSVLIQVFFDTNEAQSDRLRELATKGLTDLAANGPTDEQFKRTIENFKKRIPEKQLRNSYWSSALQDWAKYGYDSDTLYQEAVNTLTPARIQAAAAELVQNGNKIELVMKPQL